ncbi:MAG: cysteine desulfurase family protein [Cardiobacteriaceae bacterium]|nr:cysteine desulfurase family protein [Cardiobacteriaceae bacterium]
MTDWAYFDYAATTPCDARIAAQMANDLNTPWAFANTGATYSPALENRRHLADARAQLATVINADDREIVFTSGATEANNLALKGALLYHGVKQPHLITLQTEHKAVLDPAAVLAKHGIRVTVLPVQSNGLLDMDVLENALKTPTTLVSVMAVNNETGVVQAIDEIAARVHHAGAKLHVDAAQALGKIPIDVRKWDVDLLSLSGHKIYAPIGIGALFVRRLPKMRLQAQLHGGGQERGRRSGTTPLMLIRAFAYAAEIAERERETRTSQVKAHRNQLFAQLPATIHNNIEAGTPQVPHIQNLFVGCNAASVLARADAAQLALASGSACSNTTEGSHVLRSMGLTKEAQQSLRISLSHLTTTEEITRLQQFFQEIYSP